MSSHALVVDRKTQREERKEERRENPEGARRQRPVVSLVPRTRPSVDALGGEPRVSLLPAEVNDFHRERAVRRRLGVAVVGVLVIVGAGIFGAYILSTNSAAALAASRAQSATLLAQEAGFADLKATQAGIAVTKAGQMVGASTEIDWKDYLLKLQATLPTGVVVNTVTIDSASPFVDYPQSSTPLEGSRVATLSFSAMSPTLPSIPGWLDGLATLKGFADASPDSVTIQPDGSYLVNITMHINAEAFSLRYQETKK